jgi:Cohesin domain
MTRGTVALVALFALGACSSSDDGGSGHTTPSGSLAFHPAATPAGPSVTLRQKELGGGKLVLELVGHGLSDVYGVAFRLKYDSGVLAYSSLDAGPVVSQGAHVALGNAKKSGLLVGVATEKGTVAGASANDEVLATVTFAVSAEHATPIDFVAARSAVARASNGESIAGVAFVGGKLE